MDLGKKIKSVREEKKITQLQVANELGLDNSSYARIEKKGNKITVEQLQEIAKCLGVTITSLIEEDLEELDKVKELREEIARRDDWLNNSLDSIMDHQFYIKVGIQTLSKSIQRELGPDFSLEDYANGFNDYNYPVPPDTHLLSECINEKFRLSFLILLGSKMVPNEYQSLFDDIYTKLSPYNSDEMQMLSNYEKEKEKQKKLQSLSNKKRSN